MRSILRLGFAEDETAPSVLLDDEPFRAQKRGELFERDDFRVFHSLDELAYVDGEPGAEGAHAE